MKIHKWNEIDTRVVALRKKNGYQSEEEEEEKEAHASMEKKGKKKGKGFEGGAKGKNSGAAGGK